MCIKITRKVAFLSSTVGRKSQNIVVTHPSIPLFFCCHSLKLLSPTLPKLMNWILLSPSPLSSDPDNPPKFGTCTHQEIINRRLEQIYGLHLTQDWSGPGRGHYSSRTQINAGGPKRGDYLSHLLGHY